MIVDVPAPVIADNSRTYSAHSADVSTKTSTSPRTGHSAISSAFATLAATPQVHYSIISSNPSSLSPCGRLHGPILRPMLTFNVRDSSSIIRISVAFCPVPPDHEGISNLVVKASDRHARCCLVIPWQPDPASSEYTRIAPRVLEASPLG